MGRLNEEQDHVGQKAGMLNADINSKFVATERFVSDSASGGM